MRRAFLVVPIVIVVAAVVGAAAAAASPTEFGRCVKVAKGAGTYASGNCTVPGGERKFEWVAGAGPSPGLGIANKAATTMVFEAAGYGVRLFCLGAKGGGEIASAATVANVTVSFTGCESGSLACNSAGAAKGEVILAGGEASLGVIKTGETALKDRIGLSLSGSASFSCGGAIDGTITGAAIGVISPTNSMATGRTWKFAQMRARQKVERFEGGLPETFELMLGGGGGQAGFAAALIITSAEKIEINTAV